MNRRDFVRAAGSLLFAPAIVRAENLMPVKPRELLIGRVEGFSFYTGEYLESRGIVIEPVFMLAAWSRNLLAREKRALLADPWQIYDRTDGATFTHIESIRTLR